MHHAHPRSPVHERQERKALQRDVHVLFRAAHPSGSSNAASQVGLSGIGTGVGLADVVAEEDVLVAVESVPLLELLPDVGGAGVVSRG